MGRKAVISRFYVSKRGHRECSREGVGPQVSGSFVCALVGFRECARGARGGGGAALSVSQNASGWMLKKGYAVNGVAHTKHYEGVTPPCDTGGKGGFYV